MNELPDIKSMTDAQIVDFAFETFLSLATMKTNEERFFYLGVLTAASCELKQRKNTAFFKVPDRVPRT